MQQASIWPRVSLFSVGAIAVASLFVPIALSGLWDPHELDVADWGRRVAVGLLGASDLAASASTNDVPTVEEVGRGELPVLTIALSLKLFGLHQWAARLPMALFGLFCVVCTAVCCWRLGSRKAAVWAVLVLTTLPLFFVQARAALGDAATMACLAGAFFGFALAAFDSEASRIARAGFWSLGVVSAAAGFFCRGALVNVAVPGLAVGVTWLMLALAERSVHGRRFRTQDAFGAASLAIGIVGAGFGGWALLAAEPGDYWLALGGEVAPPKQFTTHDFVVRYLGHGLFPWSAFAPLAFGLLLRTPSGSPAVRRARGAFRLSLLLSLSLSLLVYGLLAPRTGPWPFAAVFAVAALIALALEEFERKPSGAPILAMASAAFLVLLYKDFDNSPERVFEAFGVSKGSLPPTLEKTTGRYFLAAASLSLVVFALLAAERIRLLARALAWLQRKLGPVRGWASFGGLCLGGLVLSAGYYPRLTALVSPKGAFDEYARHAGPGEPLAALGTDERSALFLGKTLKTLRSGSAAIDWLTTAEPSARRWLLVDAESLPNLNSKYRRQLGKKENLPIVARASADTLLASNLLLSGETNRNPFSAMLPPDKPSPQYPVHAEFDGKLRLLGWGLQDRDGKPASKVHIGETYDFLLYYEVLGRVTKDWRTFIHIDGGDTRFNADHATLGGDYAFRLWNRGDYIVDSYPVKLDSSYSKGEYQAYFGLYSGKKRFKVSEGEHEKDRILGGSIRVVR